MGLVRSQLELTDGAAVRGRFERERPKIVIHSAALSRSPACQADPAAARRANVEVTRTLTELAGDAYLVFLSTDLVFDGRSGGRRYREEDSVNPLSVYAETKVEAEAVVRRHPRHLIIRTSLNYGHTPAADRSFNEEMVLAWRVGRVLRLFTDEYRCPIAAAATAQAIWELVSRGATGLLHVAGKERLSRWEIGRIVARRHAALKPGIEAATLAGFTGAPRPPDVSLDSSRAEAALGRALPGFTAWMDQHEPVDA